MVLLGGGKNPGRNLCGAGAVIYWADHTTTRRSLAMQYSQDHPVPITVWYDYI